MISTLMLYIEIIDVMALLVAWKDVSFCFIYTEIPTWLQQSHSGSEHLGQCLFS